MVPDQIQTTFLLKLNESKNDILFYPTIDVLNI